MNIKAINLNLKYGRDQVLRDINFEISEPKIYGLLGRNGAGKTSLLSLIGSFREVTSGQLLINDENPFENDRIMQQVTFMYDKDYTGESETPANTLKDIRHFRSSFDLEYAMELLKKFKLDGHKSVANLSKGKKSAFSVVVGLASRSPITIFDEVYLGMDAATRDLFYQELLKDQELHPRIFILSTHLVSEMDHLFDEVIIIKDGQILLQEPYEDIVARGVTIIGSKQTVDTFADGKEVLNTTQLGDTKSVTLYGALSNAEQVHAQELGLTVDPVSLQDLFIQLTKEEV